MQLLLTIIIGEEYYFSMNEYVSHRMFQDGPADLLSL